MQQNQKQRTHIRGLIQKTWAEQISVEIVCKISALLVLPQSKKKKVITTLYLAIVTLILIIATLYLPIIIFVS